MITAAAMSLSTPSLASRRHFLGMIGATFTIPLPALVRGAGRGTQRIGIITDIHQDVMHDGVKRLTAFLEAMKEENVDFVIQLGDFCHPKPANAPFLEVWKGYEGSRYHVLGNHDMDGGKTSAFSAAYFEMPGRYYAFDQGPLRCVVLDGNEKHAGTRGYARHIGAEQQAWLDKELTQTTKPVLIFVHQPLDHANGIDNREQVCAILEKPRGEHHAGVVAVVSGHLHQDYVQRVGGIAHIQVNSASYVWLPGNARRAVYEAELHKAHPYLDHVAPYRDPLWAVMTIDHDAGTLTMRGRASEWVGPDPWERGAPESTYPRASNRPAISDWAGPIREG